MRHTFLVAGIAALAVFCTTARAQEAEPAVVEAVEASAEGTAEAEPTPEQDSPVTTEEPGAEESDGEPEASADEAPEANVEPTTGDDVPEQEVAEEEDDAPGEAAEEPAAAGTDWAGLIERAPAFFALTHHAAVHLPIALWLFGALFVVVGVVVPSWRNQIPLACLIGGMLTSVAAAASGWWYAQYEYGDEWAWGDMVDRERLAEGIVQHRWIAVALVVSSVILSVIALVSQAKKSRGLGVVWRVGLLLLAAAVSYEGHVGGELIMGEGFLEEAFQEWVSPED